MGRDRALWCFLVLVGESVYDEGANRGGLFFSHFCLADQKGVGKKEYKFRAFRDLMDIISLCLSNMGGK